jgi:hypothetical protein
MRIATVFLVLSAGCTPYVQGATRPRADPAEQGAATKPEFRAASDARADTPRSAKTDLCAESRCAHRPTCEESRGACSSAVDTPPQDGPSPEQVLAAANGIAQRVQACSDEYGIVNADLRLGRNGTVRVVSADLEKAPLLGEKPATLACVENALQQMVGPTWVGRREILVSFPFRLGPTQAAREWPSWYWLKPVRPSGRIQRALC